MVIEDTNGGIRGAACFAAVYRLLQKVDEICMPPSGGCPPPAKDQKMDVYNTMNDLRKARQKMVSNFYEYQYILQCVVDYVKNVKKYKEGKIPKKEQTISRAEAGQEEEMYGFFDNYSITSIGDDNDDDSDGDDGGDDDLNTQPNSDEDTESIYVKSPATKRKNMEKKQRSKMKGASHK